MMQKHNPRPETLLSEIIGMPARPYASANIEHDSVNDISGYIPNTNSVEAVNRFSTGLDKGTALSIIGPYGSGKSTFGLFLNHLAAPRNDVGWIAAYGLLRQVAPDVATNLISTRRRAGMHDSGMIRCVITARFEPVATTILRAAAGGATSYFGASYGRSNFDESETLRHCTKMLQKGITPDAATISRIIASMSKSAPVLLMIDEFGKNIEYFADGSRDGDLFLLQELAEMSGGTRGIPLHIVTMQHMALGEYVTRGSAARIKEWTKIQGRFESVHFANSLEHTRALLSSSLKPSSSISHQIMEWAKIHGRVAVAEAGVDIPPDLVASCYPLHPLAVEAIPELCSRYGQNDRTLLSFVFGSSIGTVTRFIENERWNEHDILPTMGVDHLYDYFISGSAPSRAGALAASSRLVEIDTIIRDAQVSDKTEQMVLKAIGLMNLIGRSGRLRASMGIIQCMIGEGAGQAVRNLESRSIITYRHHADEYRVWHGSDVNISAKIDVWKKAMCRMQYSDLMKSAMDPEPVIAARHGIKTGTLRIFRSLFDMPKGGIGPEYDGAMIYGTNGTIVPTSKRPALVSRCKDISGLVDTASEVAALRRVLKDDEVVNDWVAKREVVERLAVAENTLESEFDRAYGAGAVWTCRTNDKEIVVRGTASLAASKASDEAYPRSPRVRNEMINRNRLTAQGSTALKKLMNLMITNKGAERLGLDGWKPERAIYEAIIHEHGVYRLINGRYQFSQPTGQLRSAWEAALSSIGKTQKIVVLTEIYDIWKMPPYGIKDGVMPILVLLIILAKRGNVAVYEHGSYVPRINASLAERLVKNPQYFSLKYYHKRGYRVALIKKTAKLLGTNPEDDMLGIVGHLVRVVLALPAYTRKTKNLSKRALAVRDTIQKAIEPDTLLFESLPKALGTGTFGHSMDEQQISKFAYSLANAICELQTAFDSMIKEMRLLLLKETNMADRESLAKAASEIMSDASDQKMKVFLGAASASIPDDRAWINYVGLTLTDVPPADWYDEHRDMFRNGLREMSASFKRLVALRFAAVSDNFGEPSVMVTITHPDGREERIILPASDDRISKLTR